MTDMPSEFLLKTTFFENGFQKESVLAYLEQLQEEIQKLEFQSGVLHEEIHVELKPAKFGGGFEKISVLQCVEQLQARILELENLLA